MIVLACIGMMLNLAILQQPTVTATVQGNVIKAAWTVPAGRPSNDWIALYPKGASTGYVDWVYISGTRLQVDTMMGTKDFTVPGGEWDVRYIDGTSAEPYRVLATATVTVVGNNPDPGPEPLPMPRLRKLTYYEDGIKLWETETMDDAEAARHLTNVSLSNRRGVNARIEVRYATVTYGAEPDEVGTWKK